MSSHIDQKSTFFTHFGVFRPILSLAVVSVALTIASSLPQYVNGLPAPAEESTNDLPDEETPESRYLITPNESFGKIAQVQLLPAKNTGKDPVYGNLELEQTPSGVLIHGKIFGLESGKHGFHVHAIGDLGNDCKASGSHFNPQMVKIPEILLFFIIKNSEESPAKSKNFWKQKQEKPVFG